MNRKTLLRPAALALAALLWAAPGCEMPDDFSDAASSSSALSAPEADSLYNRLGGERILRGLVHRYFTLAANDPQLNLSRKGTGAQWDASAGNMSKLEDRYFQFLATALGGNKTYDGQAITSAHQNLNITPAEFDRSIELWRKALEQSSVRGDQAEEFIGVLQSVRSAVSGGPATRPG
jgi:truncated hemoglobin YjbI